MTFFKMHRVLIENIKQSKSALDWCKDNLRHYDWSNEIFDNYDCFYFNSKQVCSMFMFVNGGKYIPPPRGFENE